VMVQNTVFMKNLSWFAIVFLSVTCNFRRFQSKSGDRIFSNRQLGMTDYMRIVTLMVLQ